MDRQLVIPRELLNPRELLLMGACLAAGLPVSPGAEPPTLPVPMATATWSADEGCQWVPGGFGLEQVPHNMHYLAAPQSGEDWHQWLRKLTDYRTAIRTRLNDASTASIDLRFDGVRAWTRTARAWAWGMDLAPNEPLVVRGEARWLEGHDRLCLAFDWCDRAAGAEGAWRGWSMVVATATLPRDDAWHPFKIAVKTPDFDAGRYWARPILGMDGTFDKTPGHVTLRKLELVVAKHGGRERKFAELGRQMPAQVAFDDSVYRREDQRWMTRNFVCGFLFIYDRSFWNPDKLEYRIGPLCDAAVREFGGYDSVVIWHAYPRIGADARNQFDFFRDMPGGLAGVRDVVRELHRRGVKVFLPYNPWDTGTARERESDGSALARLVEATEADGLFLDTMRAAPNGLRAAIDATRSGVAFEPEGHPSIDEMQQCNASWAQGLQAYPELGVLHLKWIEPRHMQHQIRRWDKSHQAELAAAWLNGSGVLVWENIFGYWNPWNAEDRATLRRMAPVLRHHADHFADGEWLPYYPTGTPGVYASCWEHNDTRLWTIVRPQGAEPCSVILEIDERGAELLDLWHGVPLAPQRHGEKLRLNVPVTRYGAVAAVPRGRLGTELQSLVGAQRAEAARPIPSADDDPWVRAQSVVEPLASPQRGTKPDLADAGTLAVERGDFSLRLRHMRRECGCYPDPGTPPECWDGFLIGAPHDQTLEHRVSATVEHCRIDTRPVTNGQFEAFLIASGYRPPVPDNFLRHWGGGQCPAKVRDQPVVYVDMNDARAYAAWSNNRLPTEWEWHCAAVQHGAAFHRGTVWEWTDGIRDDGHTRFAMLRGGCRWKVEGSIWYFPTGAQPIETHAKFLLLAPGLDRCATIGFRCAY